MYVIVNKYMKKIPIIGKIENEKITYTCQVCNCKCKAVYLVKGKWVCFECFTKREKSE